MRECVTRTLTLSLTLALTLTRTRTLTRTLTLSLTRCPGSPAMRTSLEASVACSRTTPSSVIRARVRVRARARARARARVALAALQVCSSIALLRSTIALLVGKFKHVFYCAGNPNPDPSPSPNPSPNAGNPNPNAGNPNPNTVGGRVVPQPMVARC